MAIWRTTQDQRERMARVVKLMRELPDWRQIFGAISTRKNGEQCFCADGVFAQVLVEDGVARWEGYHTRAYGGGEIYKYDLYVAGYDEGSQYLSHTFAREYFGLQGIHWTSPIDPMERNYDVISLNDSYQMTLPAIADLLEAQYLIDPLEPLETVA